MTFRSVADQTSRFDNAHILLWLIKDTCWLLEWKLLGAAMIAPTIGVALYLAVRSRAEQIFWINLAICFWICANAYWMVCEFVEHEEIKNFAGLPFALGLLSVAVFYLKPDPHASTQMWPRARATQVPGHPVAPPPDSSTLPVE